MKNQPLVLSILLGLIIILIIGGVSLSVRLNDLSKEHARDLSENIELAKDNDILSKSNMILKEDIEEFQEKVILLRQEEAKLKEELEKTIRLKMKLEESLKEELMKNIIQE